MNRIFYILTILFFFFSFDVFAQKLKKYARVEGLVMAGDQHVPFATILVKGTTIGTVTDREGRYQLKDLPVGEITLLVSGIGYKPEEKVIITEANQTQKVKFELKEDVLDLEEVVVSADRGKQKRTEAPVIVNTISSDLLNSSQSVTVGEGLNFSPGLRLENNCQNCGFTQVRMNGMEGPYSQILINSRPIFSGLAGVYGLELIPVNMIEKIEIVRGGGSALFGSNAIAGTINLILKDPVINTYQMGINNSVTGLGTQGNAIDYSVNFNTSFVADDHKSGIAIYGFTRNRGMYDANNDGLSEISPMNNLTVGTRFFYRFGHRNKMTFDFFNIKEEREGGNMQDRPLHEREVAEAVGHDLKSAALTFEQYTGKNDLLSIYVSSQFLDRDSYYGANYSLADYGNSKDNTYNMGAHYKANLGNSSLVAGVENTSSLLKDEKLGFPDYENAQIVNDTILSVPRTGNTLVADQSSISTGIFAQYELKYKKFKMTLGGRYDYYEIKDYTKEDNALKSGNVFSPRVSVLYEIHKNLKARASYSQGYRAPQIFDEDLHIETSRIRKVINVNDPGLKKETSHSFMTSLDFNGLIGTIYTGLLVESFYTRLLDPFVNEIGVPDENGVVKYLRKNADDGATVKGINIELKLKPLEYFTFNSGFTFQSSVYDVAQEFDEKRFPRTPNHYGFFAVDWDFYKNFCLSTTGNYTGNMLVPYFGPGTDPDNGELRKSGNFFDSGVKLKYNIELKGVTIQCFGGLKNIFNSYQKDFDSGPDRDPAYMYGPVAPRTLYLGVKFGNLLD